MTLMRTPGKPVGIPRWVLVLGVLLSVLVLLALKAFRGPRFEGRGLGFWFPRWVPWKEVDGGTDPRTERLAAGGPGVVPLLVEGLRAGDSRLGAGYDAIRLGLPPRTQRWLPRWRGADEIRSEAFGVLEPLLRQPEHLRVFTGLVDRVPVPVLRLSAAAIASHTNVTEIAVPCLLRLLSGEEATVAAAAGDGLLGVRGLPDEVVGSVVDRLSLLPEEAISGKSGYPGILIVRHLLELGSKASAAEPWMLRWLHAGDAPRRSVWAALVLGAIDPGRFPVDRTLPGLVPKAGREGFRDLLMLMHVGESGRHPQAPGVAALLAARLAPGGTEEWAEAWKQPGDVRAAPTPDALRIQIMALALDPLPERLDAVRWGVLPLLASGNPPVARRAAFLLAREGPGAPEMIPHLIPALTNPPAAPALVLLLASYGRAAAAAAPELRRLAETPVVEGSQPRARPVVDRGQAASPVEGALGDVGRPGLVGIGLALSTGLEVAWPPTSSVSGNRGIPPGSPGRPPVVSLGELARAALMWIEGEPAP